MAVRPLSRFATYFPAVPPLPVRRIERELADKRRREQAHLAKQKELQEEQIAAARRRAEHAEVGWVAVQLVAAEQCWVGPPLSIPLRGSFLLQRCPSFAGPQLSCNPVVSQDRTSRLNGFQGVLSIPRLDPEPSPR